MTTSETEPNTEPFEVMLARLMDLRDRFDEQCEGGVCNASVVKRTTELLAWINDQMQCGEIYFDSDRYERDRESVEQLTEEMTKWVAVLENA